MTGSRVDWGYASPKSDYISFGVGTVGEFNPLTMLPETGHPFVSFTVPSEDLFPQGAEERLCANLIAVAGPERVVYFTGGLSADAMRDLLVAMPNIEYLNLTGFVIPDLLLRPDPFPHAKFLPSLRHLCLGYFNLLNGGDWGPLIIYLTHQTSGGQAISLRLCEVYPSVPPEVVKEIEGLVEKLNLGYPNDW